jgi:hypothetical protein
MVSDLDHLAARADEPAWRRVVAWTDRVDASPGMAVTWLGLGASFGVVWLALPPDAGHAPTAISSFLVGRYFWILVALASVVAASPARWLFVVQSLAIFVVTYAYEIDPHHSVVENVITAAVWLSSGFLAWTLPLSSNALRRTVVVGVTAGLALGARHLTYAQGVLILQFLFVCAAMARRPRRSWLECQRASSVTFMNVPPRDLLSSTRAPSSTWLGASLLAAALLAERAFVELAPCDGTPLYLCEQSMGLSLSDAIWSHSTPWTLLLALPRLALWLGHLATNYFAFAGVLRLLGVPVSMPMGNLLEVRNLFDYWKAVNTWRYALLKAVYIDEFFPLEAGWFGTLSIVAVFLISGLHHSVGTIARSGTLIHAILCQLVPWLIGGILCSVTFQWLLFRMRTRVRAAVLGLSSNPPSPIARSASGASCLIAVLLLMGLLLSAEEVYGGTTPFSIVAGTAPDAHRFMTGGWATRVTGARTAARPSIAANDRALYVAWSSLDDEGTLSWSKHDDAGWTLAGPLGAAHSKMPPALVATPAGIVAAWTESDEALAWASLHDGDRWGPAFTLPGTHARDEPSIAAGGNVVYIAWRGADEGMLWERFDPTVPDSASPPRPIGDWMTRATPAIAVVDGVLYAAWGGQGAQATDLWTATYNGRDWGPRRLIEGAAATSAPALAAIGHGLVLTWRGADWDPDIHFTQLVDGVWAPPARTAINSCGGAAVAGYGPGFVLASRGVESTRCRDSDYGGEWDVTSLWVTGIDLNRRMAFAIGPRAP